MNRTIKTNGVLAWFLCNGNALQTYYLTLDGRVMASGVDLNGAEYFTPVDVTNLKNDENQHVGGSMVHDIQSYYRVMSNILEGITNLGTTTEIKPLEWP